MSLFSNDRYRWRETFMVLFDHHHRPTTNAIQKALEQLGPRYEITELRGDDEQQLESLTLLAHADFAAMDISYVDGDEVAEQLEELHRELADAPLNEEERDKLRHLPDCTARFDVYHFEEIVDGGDEDDFFDPGGLLSVVEQLAQLCRGVGVDPQSGTVI